MNIFRKLLAEAISRNAGYSSNRHDRWPLEFPVGLYYADLDRDNIEQLAVSEHGLTMQQIETARPLVKWNPEYVWTDVQGQMAEGLNDNDGNRTYSPKTAVRYGLPHDRFPQRYKRRTNECAYYPAKKEGWVRESPYTCKMYRAEFSLAGRGGKHLVVDEFDGKTLRGWSADDLAETLLNNEECHYHGFTNQFCQGLLAMLDEWTQCFTSRITSNEMEFLAADQYAQRVLEVLASEEFASRQFAARSSLCTA
ncbi:hypothetical protein [Cupriavidus necator]